jgi:AcrR family transcriptional regulator
LVERRPRRERERERHRLEILQAARKIVHERGVQGVTVEHVAREADFAVGSIYRHFRSKEELILELFGVLVEDHLDGLDALLEEEAPFMDQLRAVVRFLFDRQVESRPLIQAFHAAPGDFPEPSSPAGRLLRSYPVRLHEGLCALIRRGQQTGALHEGDPMALAVALGGLVTAWSRADLLGLEVHGDPIAAITAQFLRGAAAS